MANSCSLVHPPTALARAAADQRRQPAARSGVINIRVRRTWQGKGLGRLLLRDAILRTSQAAAIIGVRGVLVHVLSPDAKRFHETSGFRESPNRPMTLVVTLRDAIAALQSPDQR